MGSRFGDRVRNKVRVRVPSGLGQGLGFRVGAGCRDEARLAARVRANTPRGAGVDAAVRAEYRGAPVWRDVGERGGGGVRIDGGGGRGIVGNALALLLPTCREGKGRRHGACR